MSEINITTEPNKKLEAVQGLIELDAKEKALKNKKGYLHAYVLSILLFPFGLFFFFKYLFFSDRTEEDVKAGIISLIITIVIFFLGLWFANYSIQQMNLINPNSSTILKDLIVPSNLKDLKQLFQ